MRVKRQLEKVEEEFLEEQKRRRELVVREALKIQLEENERKREEDKRREAEEDNAVASHQWPNWGAEDRGKLIREENRKLLMDQIEINGRNKAKKAEVGLCES